MACCSNFFNSLPQGWEAIPKVSDADIKKSEVQDLELDLHYLIYLRNAMTDEYQANVLIRTAAIALVAIAITVGMLALQGQLTTFPSAVVNYFQQVNWIHFGIGAAIVTVLTTGAAIVIYRAHHEEDKLTKGPGTFAGDAAWIPSFYHSDKHGYHLGHIDISTLDKDGNGYAYMFARKDEQGHCMVSSTVSMITPVYLIGVIVYNIIRTVVVPFYIIGTMIAQKCSDTPVPPKQAFSLTDIPLEMGKSIGRIVTAPFYALAFIFAGIYSLVDAMNGRKLGFAIEKAWNGGLSRAEGYWSVGGPQTLWKWEGGGGKGDLGKNGFFLAGCWQPVARVQYLKGKIYDAESVTHSINPAVGLRYSAYDVAGADARYAAQLAKLKTLITA